MRHSTSTAGTEKELARVGDRGREQWGPPPLLGGATRQSTDPGLPKEEPDGMEADRAALRAQSLGDVDHTEALFVTEAKNRLPERLGDGAVLATVGNVPEERRKLVPTELGGQDLEGVGRVVEPSGCLGGGTPLEEVGAEGLVAALEGVTGLAEEVSRVAHIGSCISQQ